MKKYILILTWSVSTFSFCGCDKIYSLIHKEGAEEKAIVGQIIPFEANPTVEEIQILLNVYGYACGDADGVLGAMTRDAIARFQKENGLEETRFVDDATWAKLKELRDQGFVKDGQLNLVYLQQLLNASGYSVGDADGRWGSKTAAAVKKFQKDNGLVPDGKVGYKTLRAMSANMAGQSAGPAS